MNDNVFAEWIEKLGKNFGIRGQVLEDKKEIWWQEFKHITDDVFERGCRSILENEERFPTIAKIKMVLDNTHKSFHKDKEISRVDCNLCDGSGYVSTVKDKVYDFVFRCNCQNGDLINSKIPRWEQKWLKDHVLRNDFYGIELDKTGEFDLNNAIKMLSGKLVVDK